MLYQLDIIPGKVTPIEWWPTVPALKGITTLKFQPGLNILVGPNGTGKSSIIKALAKLTHCEQGGKPKITDTSSKALGLPRPYDPTEFNYATGKKRKGFVEPVPDPGMVVTTNGEPTFYFTPDATPGVGGGGAYFDHDFMGDIGYWLHGNRSSSGQGSRTKLERILIACKTETCGPLRAERDWEKAVLAATIKVVASDAGVRTLLLDEPERSLDYMYRLLYWRVIRNFVRAHGHQVIIASHATEALTLPASEANFIEVEPGYLKLCKQLETGELDPVAVLRAREGDETTPEGQAAAKRAVKDPKIVPTTRRKPKKVSP